jgi:hypothetical protein
MKKVAHDIGQEIDTQSRLIDTETVEVSRVNRTFESLNTRMKKIIEQVLKYLTIVEIVLEIPFQLCSRRSQIICYRVGMEYPIQSPYRIWKY